MSTSIPQENILGVKINAIDMKFALEYIDQSILGKKKTYICVTPAHGVMECQKKPGLRRIFNNSGLTTPDGMSIVWILRLKGHRDVGRVYGPDLMLAVCERSSFQPYRHYLYGSTEKVIDKLRKSLETKFKELKIVGSYSPPFRQLTPEENSIVVSKINSSNPDIVWVGLGSPKQEQWMAENAQKLTASVLIGVGAAFDFLSGEKRQAPYWMQRSGTEWLFRLSTEPKRLWKRYIVYPIFGVLVAAQALNIKKYTLE